MGFGFLARPFKDIHKAVKKVGGGVHKAAKTVTGGVHKAAKATVGAGHGAAMGAAKGFKSAGASDKLKKKMKVAE